MWWGVESASLLPWDNCNDPEEDLISVAVHVSQGGLLIKNNLSAQGHLCFIWFFRWGEASLLHLPLPLSSLSSSSSSYQVPIEPLLNFLFFVIMDLVASIQGDKDKQAMLLTFSKSLQAEWRLLMLWWTYHTSRWSWSPCRFSNWIEKEE